MIRAAAILLILAPATWAEQCTASWTHGPQKIRPFSAEAIQPPGPLRCARNSYCSFQVIVEARGGECRDLRAAISEFRNVAGQPISSSEVTVYRQEFVNVFYRSTEQGDIGEWPDPLIPDVDPDYGEQRNAFPARIRLFSPAYKSYRAERGRTVSKGRSFGLAHSGGEYRSRRYQQFVLRITKGGPLGAARFVWWSQPGAAEPSRELPVQARPVPLSDGLTVRFEGAGREDDFRPGDEFWIWAGPARRQPLWVDLFIPAGASPGTYHGAVQLTFDSHQPLSLPIEMEVAAALLPSTSSLATHFGFYLRGTYEYHYGFRRVDPLIRELGRAYARAGLRNRITLESTDEFDPVYEFDAEGRVRKADYSRYDAAWADFLDGRGTPHGATWSSLRMPRFRNLTGTQLLHAARDFSAHARQRGWADRLFDYTFDEPGSPQQYAALRARAEVMREAAPDVPRLATTPLQKNLFGVVTRWCPLVENYLPETPLRLGPRAWLNWWRERNAWRPQAGDYQERLRAGDSLWLYISCIGHGCSETGRYPWHKDKPAFLVDVPATVNQLLATIAATSPGVTGLLYWDVSYADHHEGGAPHVDLGPWESTYYFGGNGEGSLFYPGVPDHLGGKSHFPVESLRLKFIRESLVDAELLHMLRKQGMAQEAADAAALIRRPAGWDTGSAPWVSFRNALLAKVRAADK